MKTKFERTQQDLAAALRALRLLVKEVGGNYLSALQADVARVEKEVADAQQGETFARKQLSELSAMLKRITELDVKPQKGRRRDLKEIDKIITRLSDIVDNW
jgi:septal ring factor EnvC (AmiA/AmiB activator)